MAILRVKIDGYLVSCGPCKSKRNAILMMTLNFILGKITWREKNIMNLRTLLLLNFLLFAPNCFSNPIEEPQFDKLSWLTGCWKGTGLGGEVEECWVQSADRRLTSVFQMTKDGQQQFSEIVMIAEFDGRLAMRVKHFDTSFTQWASDQETGVTFPFVEMGENYIQFEGLRYELIDGVCHVTLDMKDGDEVRQVGFKYNRN